MQITLLLQMLLSKIVTTLMHPLFLKSNITHFFLIFRFWYHNLYFLWSLEIIIDILISKKVLRFQIRNIIINLLVSYFYYLIGLSKFVCPVLLQTFLSILFSASYTFCLIFRKTQLRSSTKIKMCRFSFLKHSSTASCISIHKQKEEV